LQEAYYGLHDLKSFDREIEKLQTGNRDLAEVCRARRQRLLLVTSYPASSPDLNTASAPDPEPQT
jgi:hypothetical protein